MKMDISLQEPSSLSNSKEIRKNPRTIVCLSQNLCLPSNLLQKKKNIIQQYRMLKSSQNSRVLTSRQPTALMNKTFCHSQNQTKNISDTMEILLEDKVEKGKRGGKEKKLPNPLYRRLSNIQADNKELAGISYSKLLSRMLVVETEKEKPRKQFSDYRKRKNKTIDVKTKQIQNYQCLQSKLFTIQCPQINHQSARTSPIKNTNQSTSRKKESNSNRLFKRYFNPHGDKTDMISQLESLQFDQRYIYRNGKKSECKRIHNFYTSQMFKKTYEKHMTNTIDTYYSVSLRSKY